MHDLCVAALSLVLAYYLRVGSDLYLKSYYWPVLVTGVPLFTLIAGLTFQFSGMYRGIWRYASVPDLIAITKASLVSIAIFVGILFVWTRLQNFPRSVAIIQLFLLVAGLGGPRILYRLWRDQRVGRDRKKSNENAIPVLLVGADDGSEMFIRAAMTARTSDYEVLGILDPKGDRGGRALLGVDVYAYDENHHLSDIVERIAKKKGRKIQKVIFTNPDQNQDGDLVRELDAQVDSLGLTMARLPNITAFKKALADGEVSVQSFDIEDLLGRAQAPLDKDAIASFIAGKRVLITGAGGTIGSELTRQIAAYDPAHLTLLDQGEYNLYMIDQEIAQQRDGDNYQAMLCDIRDRDRVFRIFDAVKPDIVFHAAALKHVPMVELNPEEGILTNLIGTRNVADAALEHGATAMVQISTDKAVNPTNIMGASKRLGELYAQSLDLKAGKTGTRYMTVRFGNVLGSSGSVVPLFQKQLAKGGPLTVTHPDIKRFFMTVREASGLVLQASAKGIMEDQEKGRIFVLDMGKPILIQEVARKVIRLANLRPDVDIKIVFTGLRPGEKLYEELFDTSETPLNTNIDGVMAAKPQAVEREVLQRSFALIEKAARAGDIDGIKRLLAQIVKGYNTAPNQADTKEDKNDGYTKDRP